MTIKPLRNDSDHWIYTQQDIERRLGADCGPEGLECPACQLIMAASARSQKLGGATESVANALIRKYRGQIVAHDRKKIFCNRADWMTESFLVSE